MDENLLAECQIARRVEKKGVLRLADAEGGNGYKLELDLPISPLEISSEHQLVLVETSWIGWGSNEDQVKVVGTSSAHEGFSGLQKQTRELVEVGEVVSGLDLL